MATMIIYQPDELFFQNPIEFSPLQLETISKQVKEVIGEMHSIGFLPTLGKRDLLGIIDCNPQAPPEAPDTVIGFLRIADLSVHKRLPIN